MSLPRYQTIQGLRFVAALGVVVGHSAFYARERLGSPAPTLDFLGAMGVGLFFAISGFIMTRIHDEDPDQDWRRFIRRRVARVIPMYWIMTTFKLATILVAADVVITAAVDPVAVVRSYLLLPSFNELGHIEPLWTVGWTLMFEMMFYLLVAVAMAARVDPVVLAAPVLIALAIASVARAENGSASPSGSLPDSASEWWFYADPVVLYFLAGMAIARAARRRSRASMVIAVAAVFALAVLSGLLARAEPVMHGLVFAALVGILGIAVGSEGVLGARVPRWIVVSGTASYSLYLTHPIVAQIVPETLARLGAVDLPWAVVVAGSTVVAALAAPLVHRFAEAPLTRLVQHPRAGRRVSRHRAG